MNTLEIKLKHIASLAGGNNHHGARWYTADLFPYLALYKRQFALIEELCAIEGCLPALLGAYRENVTLQMLHEIEKNEGFEIKNKIKANL